MIYFKYGYCNLIIQINRDVQIPSFIPEGLAEKIFHSGKCLRLLKECCPDHPLFYNYKDSKAFIYWIFNENDIQKLHQDIDTYEEEINNNIYMMNKNLEEEKRRLEEQKKLELYNEDIKVINMLYNLMDK